MNERERKLRRTLFLTGCGFAVGTLGLRAAEAAGAPPWAVPFVVIGLIVVAVNAGAWLLDLWQRR